MGPTLLWNSAAGLIWEASRIIIYGFTAFTLFLAAVAVYRLLLHPLARVPGPRLAALSNAWYAYHVRNGRTVELGRKLHQKYGEVVRVGPNELWFNSKEAFDTIYNTTKGFEKTDFYLATSLIIQRIDWRLQPHFYDSLDLLSERDAKRYRLQRRLIGRVYQTANILRHEEAIDSVLKQVIARLEGLQGQEIDLKEWMHIIAVECLGASVLSWSPGLLKDGTDWSSSSHSYLGWRRKSVLGLFPTMAKLGLRSKWVDWIFRDIWGLTFTSPDSFKSFFPDVGKRINRRIKAALVSRGPKVWKMTKVSKGSKGQESERQDLLADLIQLHKEKPEFTEMYLRKMAVTNFGAGHETMASTLTSIVAMIGTHANVQKRVAEEVRSLNDPASCANASNLPYMRAAAREAMRLNPVLSMSLPRLVPGSGLQLHGYFIPGDTTVGCNPVALHRNEEIIGPDPDSYDPDRWLDADLDEVRVMERYNLNWGGGARTCPGKNLAEMVVYKVVPALLTHFDVEVTLPPESDRPSYFLSMMSGVKARFQPVDKTDNT
ncbi:Cytochrome P450 monooxygenase sdnT [Cladobotryum mycophilum]|uniref:Cytochrome P450 monooxygenase sdnT n=1 Tax=Cladobotryum mycophilum TaxID=491253 RepID=A0ABR0SXP8_9HYPO